MNFREIETEKIKNKIKSKVMIFPSWDGRGYDNKVQEYEAHKDKYAYPMDKIEIEIMNQSKDPLFEAAKSYQEKFVPGLLPDSAKK